MKFKFFIFLLFCLVGISFYYYNQNKFSDLKEVQKELQINEFQKGVLLDELKDEMQLNLDPKKINLKEIKWGEIPKATAPSPTSDLKETKICTREFLPKVEKFLKELTGQFIYRTDVSPCGEIVGRSIDLQEIKDIISFVERENPKIKIHLGQDDSPSIKGE